MVRPAPGAARAITILDYLSARPTRAFTLTQIARATGLVMASTQTALTELANAGYVVRHRVHKTYSIGPLLSVFGHAARSSCPAIDLAASAMERLSAELGRETIITVSAGDEIVTIGRAGRRHSRSLEIGERVPLGAPIGAGFVAWAGEDEIERWRGDRESVDPELYSLYDQILATTRVQGYSVLIERTPHVKIFNDAIAWWATAHPEPTTRQHLQLALRTLAPTTGTDLRDDLTFAVRSLGAPVFDAEGRAVLSISIADLPDPLSPTELSELGVRFREAATAVTKQTDGSLPPGWP